MFDLALPDVSYKDLSVSEFLCVCLLGPMWGCCNPTSVSASFSDQTNDVQSELLHCLTIIKVIQMLQACKL